MDLSRFAEWYLPAGMLIGFVAAAPIGPVNILVIQRALQRGVPAALVMGLGAALGDMLFASIAAFGLSTLTSQLHASQPYLRIGGGAIMLGFAILLWRSRPQLDNRALSPPRNRHMAAALFLMTVTNPATVLWFLATFQAVGFRNIGVHSAQASGNAALVVLGAFVGSMAWWTCIAGFASLWRTRINDRHLVLANHIAALVLGASGVAAILAGLM